MASPFLWVTRVRVSHQVCCGLIVQSGVTCHRGGNGIVGKMSKENERKADLSEHRTGSSLGVYRM
jgi:hypothetical protein